MKLRALASLVVASSILAFAGTASAQAPDTSRVMGLRFEATLFRPFDVRGITMGGPDNDELMPAAFEVARPGGDIRIGYDLPMGLTPLVGIGIRSHSVNVYNEDDELVTGNGRTDINLAVELRYYFGPHSRGLQPFIFGEFNTLIASFGSSFHEDAPDARQEAADDVNRRLGDTNSMTNFNAGLGMEYKFARAFAVGAKWGFGLSLAPASFDEDLEKPGLSNTVFGTSSTIYAAFRL